MTNSGQKIATICNVAMLCIGSYIVCHTASLVQGATIPHICIRII